MKRYGKTLMHHVPDGTTLLLKGLCTDYQPNRDTTDRDSLDRGPTNKVSLSDMQQCAMLTILNFFYSLFQVLIFNVRYSIIGPQ